MARTLKIKNQTFEKILIFPKKIIKPLKKGQNPRNKKNQTLEKNKKFSKKNNQIYEKDQNPQNKK